LRPSPERSSAPDPNCSKHLIVEKNHLAVPGQAVGDGRIPIIHGSAEMLVEDERHAVQLAEAAIGETNAVALDELRWSGLVIVLGH
jgi:hypothetical protein